MKRTPAYKKKFIQKVLPTVKQIGLLYSTSANLRWNCKKSWLVTFLGRVMCKVKIEPMAYCVFWLPIKSLYLDPLPTLNTVPLGRNPHYKFYSY